jgi:hypothetical protein
MGVERAGFMSGSWTGAAEKGPPIPVWRAAVPKCYCDHRLGALLEHCFMRNEQFSDPKGSLYPINDASRNVGKLVLGEISVHWQAHHSGSRLLRHGNRWERHAGERGLPV